jgi:hypothetical protein
MITATVIVHLRWSLLHADAQGWRANAQRVGMEMAEAVQVPMDPGTAQLLTVLVMLLTWLLGFACLVLVWLAAGLFAWISGWGKPSAGKPPGRDIEHLPAWARASSPVRLPSVPPPVQFQPESKAPPL